MYSHDRVNNKNIQDDTKIRNQRDQNNIRRFRQRGQASNQQKKIRRRNMK